MVVRQRKDAPMDYQLTEGTDFQGNLLYTARHIPTGQPVDSSQNRAEMEARVQQLNEGRPYSDWTRQYRPDEYARSQAVDPATTCHFCGLDVRTHDCGDQG